MLEWENVDTVLLDMDGTLLDLNFDNHFWQEFVPLRYAQQKEIPLEQAHQILAPQFKSMEGRLEWYCLDYWSEVLQLDIAGLKMELAGLIAVLPHVTDFLQSLQQSSKRVLLVTNAHQDSLNLKMEKTCLQTFFDAIISSHELGIPKEHTDFWSQLQGQEPFDVQRTLLVDDSLAVLRSARNFGIRYLIAVRRPDSRQGRREITEFSGIDDFRELLFCA